MRIPVKGFSKQLKSLGKHYDAGGVNWAKSPAMNLLPCFGLKAGV